jgi:hypothetical protein
VARATLRVTLACSNRCIFCAQEGVKETAEEAPRGDVTIVGGEPGLVEDLVERVTRARAVALQTNGYRLAERANDLARAGLREVQVSLHGADSAIHDYHTGVDGSFAQLLSGVAAARAAGLRVVASTVLTRSNFRGMDALARLIHQRGISAWLIAVPEVVGRAARNFDRVVPRLGMALPFALHAASLARGLGLPAFLQGAPLCLLGPLASLSLPSLPRAYAPVCQGCDARRQCCGVDAKYLARFDGDELQRRSLVPPVEDPGWFAGVGEMSLSVEESPPSSPGAARRQLPLYGKVTPASREASPATPKKSGEALREIFPALWKK